MERFGGRMFGLIRVFCCEFGSAMREELFLHYLVVCVYFVFLT